MDTLTHALSGALLARATAPRESRLSTPARMAAGFVAAAFPDIDFVLGFISPEAYVTGHRGLTHSIILLPLWACALAWLFARCSREARWQDLLGVCALGIGFHILGDLITSFGTVLLAPVSDLRVAWSTTFIIDLWLSGIIVAGLVAAGLWRRSRVPAMLGLAALAGYVGFQAMLHERAVAFGQAYANTLNAPAARVSAIPRPVSPFNWMVMIAEPERYHYAQINLRRTAALAPASANDNLIARLDAPYLPLSQAQWTAVQRYGSDAETIALATTAWSQPALAFYRWFADYPRLYRIDHGNPSTCVWFEDLRFLTPGRDEMPFRFGVCKEEDAPTWEAFELKEDGRKIPAD